jgi:hypothetical protein
MDLHVTINISIVTKAECNSLGDGHQTKGLKRDTVDKFYTKSSIVKECCLNIQKFLNVGKSTDIIIEPSAGNGAFMECINSMCDKTYFYDLKPDNINITQQDFLKLDYTKFKNKSVHIIGNPPFGRQSSMAIKFIRLSAKFASSISFILPKSFKKASLKRKIPLKFHCVYEADLPYNSFLLNNNEYDVPCVFQIWQKQSGDRVEEKKLTPTKYTFVKKTDSHDISFRRVGVNAGNIDTDTLLKSPQSHYFIKFDKGIFNKALLDKLNALEFTSSNDTVGPKSISQQELIKEFVMVV